jgi:hypothetical protein
MKHYLGVTMSDKDVLDWMETQVADISVCEASRKVQCDRRVTTVATLPCCGLGLRLCGLHASMAVSICQFAEKTGTLMVCNACHEPTSTPELKASEELNGG